MKFDAVVGCFVLVTALIAVTVLVLWSRYIIEFISKKNLRSVREIKKELEDKD